MANDNDVKQETPDSAEQKSAQAEPETLKKDPVKRWTIIILVVSIALIFWYLRSDRVTPMTSQARVHALVVPVAAEVSGTVTSVAVSNNQLVEAGQELFRLDEEQLRFSLLTAEAALDQTFADCRERIDPQQELVSSRGDAQRIPG